MTRNGTGIFRARAGIQYIPKYQSLVRNTIKKILFNNIELGSNIVADVQRSLFHHRHGTEEELEKLQQEQQDGGITSDTLNLKILHFKLKCALLLSNEPSNGELVDALGSIKDPTEPHEDVLKRDPRGLWHSGKERE